MVSVYVLIVCGLAAPALSGVQRGRIPQFAGPIKVVGKELANCPADMQGKNLHRFTSAIIKQTRDKPLPRVFANMSLMGPFDDGIQAFLSLASWSRVSGWAPNAVSFLFRKFCSDLRAFYRDLVDRLEQYIPDGHKFCPHHDPTNIFINGAPAYFTPNRKLVVAFPYGRWRVDVKFKQNDTVLGCVRIIADTIPLNDN